MCVRVCVCACACACACVCVCVCMCVHACMMVPSLDNNGSSTLSCGNRDCAKRVTWHYAVDLCLQYINIDYSSHHR